jgi:hypothetical protein
MDSADQEHCNRLYTIYRNYIEHEDSLVNHRTTWLITIQSFLIATLGLTYQALLEPLSGKVEPITPRSLLFFQAALATVGFFTSFVAYLSLRAAGRSIRSIRRNWERQPLAAACRLQLPALTGGGDSRAPRMGFSFPLLLPAFFMVFWVVMADFLIHGATHLKWLDATWSYMDALLSHLVGIFGDTR